MADQIVLQITIQNPGDPEAAKVTGEVLPTETPKPPVSVNDVQKIQYVEAMNDYRHFGSLRAQVAWAPATIAMTLATFVVTRDFVSENTPLWYLVPAFLLIIFVIIYLANHYLQLKQRNCSNVAKKLEHLWNKGDTAVRTYHGLLSDTSVRADGVRYGQGPDKSSKFLAIFFVILLGVHMTALIISVGGLDAYLRPLWTNNVP